MTSINKFLECVESIYVESPSYEVGHDGSDGKCDCIGLVRGALMRAGETDIKNLNGTNQASRKAIRNLEKLKKEGQLQLGDVVLKTRDKDDSSMRLPDRYRKGNSDYDEKVGEINFTHIGVVTKVNPIEITHMTSPTAKKDSSIKGWSYFGQLPYVSDYEDDPTIDKALVFAESGSTVKMREKPSTFCRLYWNVPIGSEIIVLESGESWSKIFWNGKTGYMMSKFIMTDFSYCLVIPHLSKTDAEILKALYPSSYIEIEGG